jgi:hypothetical protein
MKPRGPNTLSGSVEGREIISPVGGRDLKSNEKGAHIMNNGIDKKGLYQETENGEATRDAGAEYSQCISDVEDLLYLLNGALGLFDIFNGVLDDIGKVPVVDALRGFPQATKEVIYAASEILRFSPVWDASFDKVFDAKRTAEKLENKLNSLRQASRRVA